MIVLVWFTLVAACSEPVRTDTATTAEQTDELVRLLAENKQRRSDLDARTDDTYLDPLDRELAEVCQEWMTTVDMVDGHVAYGNKWREKMEHYLHLLHEELDPERRSWLMVSQEQWETFADANAQLQGAVYSQCHEGGTLVGIEMACSYYDRYRTRAMELKSLYETLTFDR